MSSPWDRREPAQPGDLMRALVGAPHTVLDCIFLLPEKIVSLPYPNPTQTWFEFVEEASCFALLTGSVVLWVNDINPSTRVINPAEVVVEGDPPTRYYLIGNPPFEGFDLLTSAVIHSSYLPKRKVVPKVPQGEYLDIAEKKIRFREFL